MINRIKNIISLTKIFLQNSFYNPYFTNKKKNKNGLEKKSLKSWTVIFIMIAMIYISYMFIGGLREIGRIDLFLNFMLLILVMVLVFQISLICTNVYYYSKDLDLILPLPIKSVDLLISKLNAIIINSYFFEFIFILFPLIIYGISISAGLLYFAYLVILLLIFPVLPALVVSIIMMFLMKLSKFIKNKDIFQIFITFIFVTIVMFSMFNVVKSLIVSNNGQIITEEAEAIERVNEFNERLKNMNNYFMEVNSGIELLNNSNKIGSILNIFKIILIDVVFFILFIFIGKITYLKNILKGNIYNTAKKIKKINLDKKCRKNNKLLSYIGKEFKMLFKSPIFFMQCIGPTVILCVTILIILLFAVPNIRGLIDSGLMEGETITFDFNAICLSVIVIQIMLTFSSTSITAISREGKNATLMKIFPIDYYQQIICKSIPQVFVNMCFIFIISCLIKAVFYEASILSCIYIFIIANLLSVFNSLLMVIVDLNDPNLEWNAEFEVVNNSNKKIYQYALTILIILLINYCSKVFEYINMYRASSVFIIVLGVMLIILNLIIDQVKYKLFNKIK